ncbi:hypothetical protein RYA95_27465 [Pseudomonas syringae pv. actinidiae]|nr:hypothetical protein [Pseudomonas syringae]MDU8269306.1 hypothetical protein [Pseudomonas syringae pv. actinidiae]MDU8285309.1 hypothetical protein [Pseudomonas syringae pv. actinidiae]MDU8306628.1 hypothetical protein [Pseudomonas syringae pv. actinidiae]MDU8616745.1 hypothetical protein [Pseudomonas syringae pv. actinidiae]OSN28483.1 hypothetical protein BV343_05375 [Pseudomonas syringae pv. actinidiae]
MKDDFNFNPHACSINDLNPGCEELWSIGQQVAVRRLSVQSRVPCLKPAQYTLISDFSARAARIAGSYARIYLEHEIKGKPELKGRFYWTGLAAFASKQVMCALDYSSTSKWRYAFPSVPAFEKTKYYLGKGNFWLFQDIFVWHWFYINFPAQFNECIEKRDFNTYNKEFKASFNKLPWAEDALLKIKNLKVTDHLRLGFSLMAKFETTRGRDAQRQQQLASLIAIANHEQLNILQPLIYESIGFQALLYGQSKLEGHLGVPRRLAAFSTACESDAPKFNVTMTEGQLYDPTERMKFITKIADKFHTLMDIDKKYMENTIMAISSWHDHA